MMRARILVALGAVVMALGCARLPRVKIADLSAARLPATAKIVIDGRADEPPWKEAAAIPLEETGRALFLWDERKLYGFVEKYERHKWGFDHDEQICVSIWAGRRIVKLFLGEEQLRERQGALALRQAWAAELPAETSTREVLPTGAVEVASFAGCTKRGYFWSFEFSVKWDCLAEAWTSGETAWVSVYRLAPQPLTTRVGRIERVRAEDGPQSEARGDGEGAAAQP